MYTKEKKYWNPEKLNDDKVYDVVIGERNQKRAVIYKYTKEEFDKIIESEDNNMGMKENEWNSENSYSKEEKAEYWNPDDIKHTMYNIVIGQRKTCACELCKEVGNISIETLLLIMEQNELSTSLKVLDDLLNVKESIVPACNCKMCLQINWIKLKEDK